MVSSMTISHLTLSDLERSMSKSVRFRSIIPRKGAGLDNILPLNTNRKAYMWSPIVRSQLTLMT